MFYATDEPVMVNSAMVRNVIMKGKDVDLAKTVDLGINRDLLRAIFNYFALKR